MNQRESQDAPGHLEVVRTFLKTWSIPNETRVPVDQLVSVEAMENFRAVSFPHLPTYTSRQEAGEEVEMLRRLRSDLRQALQSGQEISISIINGWLERIPIAITLEMGDQGEGEINYRPVGKAYPLCGALLALVMEAWAMKTWRRLKVCPDCQTVFYDTTKNTSRVWCSMVAQGPGGRSCGSIAKVRRWRQRHKAISLPVGGE